MVEGVAELVQEVQQSWHWNSKRAGFCAGWPLVAGSQDSYMVAVSHRGG